MPSCPGASKAAQNHDAHSTALHYLVMIMAQFCFYDIHSAMYSSKTILPLFY